MKQPTKADLQREIKNLKQINSINASGMAAFSTIESALRGAGHATRTERMKRGHFDFIPLHPQYFIQLMRTADKLVPTCKNKEDRHKPISFLDVGCGIGTKVVLAEGSLRYARCYGLEFDPAYVAVAKTLIPYRPDAIIQADALKYDGYGIFDIIYMYRPLCNRELQEKLEVWVCNQAKPGAVIVCAACGCAAERTGLLDRVSGTHEVWVRNSKDIGVLSKRSVEVAVHA